MPINMLPHILKYFRAEKDAGLYLLVIGGFFLLLGVGIWVSRSRIRATAIPLATIAIVELIVGATMYLRTDKQIDTITGLYYSDRAAYQQRETARMESVMSGLRIYKIIEAATIVAGLAMLAAYRKRSAVAAAGVGLVVQASLLLVFDLIASQRAQTYLEALRQM